VSTVLVEKAPAKINLTLRVIGRRADGCHDLESVVAFADIGDTLTLQTEGELSLEITGPYASFCGPCEDNLVLKAANVLHESVPALVGGKFVLEKNLPVAAGIGGGSADAAAALRLLARANGLFSDDIRLFSAARAVGADVPVCLDPKARIMRGTGDVLSQAVEIPSLPALLVNPGVPIATRDVFARLQKNERGSKIVSEIPRKFDALIAFLNECSNDLTSAAAAYANIIDDVLNALRALPGALLVRMSGSGSTCFALFESTSKAMAAAQKLRTEHKEWWICATKFS
jgi:4-diphosphocytidyl-2-C-methyl-D-erythritol kinase